MLVLSTLTKLLGQIISEDVHIAILTTTSGGLVSYETYGVQPRDRIRVLIGLSAEIWSKSREEEFGMAESEVRVCIFNVFYTH